MTTTEANNPTTPPPPPSRKWSTWTLVGAILVVALLTCGVTFLLTTIIEHKQEEKNPWVRLVEVDQNTTDPAQWGKNWSRQYDGYLRTVDNTRTVYGGSESFPKQKAEQMPFLTRMFAGYAFSIDYRDRRGHAFMLADQEQTERVTKKPQPGACLHCHASVIPTYRRIGIAALTNTPPDQVKLDPNDFNWPAVMEGFKRVGAMTYTQAHAELYKTPDGTPPEQRAGSNPTVPAPPTTGPTTREALASQVGEAHPVSCVDCHDPQTMMLRVTRPGFVNGIQALAASSDAVPHLPSVERWRQGNRAKPYDPNTEATRQEMRSFACAQCHVEYYCGPKTTLIFPWGNGLKVEQIEAFYDNFKFPDGHRFFDWKHAETGAELLKAQHPEFEMWSQGLHARSGVACADCHMPYKREGAVKVSEHHIQSPLLMINQSCQVCHPYETTELKARVDTIQARTHKLQQEAGKALIDLLDAIKAAKAGGATDEQLAPVFALQRKAQWRLDFSAAENSTGFHAPAESARILAESIDYSRQGQIEAMKLTSGKKVADAR
jgi:nitrite reductase (cytochrome c-552)